MAPRAAALLLLALALAAHSASAKFVDRLSFGSAGVAVLLNSTSGRNGTLQAPLLSSKPPSRIQELLLKDRDFAVVLTRNRTRMVYSCSLLAPQPGRAAASAGNSSSSSSSGRRMLHQDGDQHRHQHRHEHGDHHHHHHHAGAHRKLQQFLQANLQVGAAKPGWRVLWCWLQLVEPDSRQEVSRQLKPHR
jgi:hypothetical protein